MMLAVVPIYAALLALLFVFLGVRVIRQRGRARVGLGDGGDRALARAIRVHGNFAEYVPLALLLLAFAELGGAAAWLVHLGGALLLAGRLAHAYGVSQEAEDLRLRVAGMALTFTVLVGTALVLLRSLAVDAG